jgi:hypothetical protein
MVARLVFPCARPAVAETSDACRDQSEGKDGEMNEGAAFSRFLARQDARGLWMVWDREHRRPVDRRATGLTQQKAKEIAERLELDPSATLE